MSSTKTKTTSEAVSPSFPAEVAQRIAEIRAEVEPVKALHTKWQSEPEQDSPPPELVNVLMPQMAFALLQRADFPQVLAGAWTALNVWSVLLVRVLKSDGYVVDVHGMPTNLFWTKFHDFLHGLNVKPKARRVLPKFARLWEDFSGDPANRYKFIANEFAITNKETGMKEGLFTRPDGSHDSLKIQREHRNPGSVIPPDFDPETNRVAEMIKMERPDPGVMGELQRHLKEYGQEKQKKQEAEIDPASVEELLRMRMFPAVIARVKQIPEAEVREIARKLRIRCTEPSDMFGLAEIHDEEDAMIRRSMLGEVDANQPDAVELSMDDEPAMDEVDSDDDTDFEAGLDDEDELELDSDSDSEAELDEESDSESDVEEQTPELTVDSVLQKLIDENPNIDTPRAMVAIKAAGLKSTGPDVGRRLGVLRQTMLAAAAASEAAKVG